MANRFSTPYKRRNRTFIYDREHCLVIWVSKMDKEMKRENEEWLKDHTRPLFDEVIPGYMEIDSVGLRKENWTNKSMRDSYLDMYNDEIDEEVSYLY